MAGILYAFDRRFMWKTFAAIDRHVDAPSTALPLRPEAAGGQTPAVDRERSIETAADFDAAVAAIDPDVVVQNNRFASERLDERPSFYDEYPVVHVRHGASVGRGEVAKTTRDLADRVDLALAPGERWAVQYEAQFPDDVDVATVGIPEADDLVGRDPPRRRRVLYAPTNHRYGAGSYLATAEHVLDVVADSDYELLFRPHPMDRIEEPAKSLTERCVERIADLPNVTFDERDSPQESMLAADLLVSDYSGIVTEWLHTGRPLVQLTDVAADVELPVLGHQTGRLDRDLLDRLYEEGYSPPVERAVDETLSDLGIPMDGRAGERAAAEVTACTA